jgi:hypothetical protein
MAEIPAAQLVVAVATYCTVVLTELPFVGAETETLAKAKVPQERISSRANHRINVYSGGRAVQAGHYVCRIELFGFYGDYGIPFNEFPRK